jgi:hypothetical protein
MTFVFFLETIAGIAAGAIAATITATLSPFPWPTFLLVLLIDCGASFAAGYGVPGLVAYLHRGRTAAIALVVPAIAACTFLGLTSVIAWGTGGDAWLGIAGAIVVGAIGAICLKLFKSFGRIWLFTDGIRIGSWKFMYSDILAIGLGTGKKIEKNFPPEAAGKPVTLLTPLDFEYIAPDFGIFHVYLVIVTADSVFVVQSLYNQSNMAQDVKNAWSRCVFGHE